MKNKGFTLVELLAVVAILMLLITVITPKVIRQLNNSESVTQKEQINTLIDIAKIYTSENTLKLPEENEISIITINELKEAGLINQNQIIDPKTKEEMTGCMIIKNQNNKIEYEYSDNSIKCNIATLVVTTGDGLYESTTDPGRLIYRGTNPNNKMYIKEDGINNTLYRIVSLEPDGTIKVVRDEKLNNNMSWDKTGERYNDETNDTYCTSNTGCNVWGNQNTMLYNGTPLEDNFHYMYYASPTALTLTSGESGKVSNASGKNASLNEYLNSMTNDSNTSWQPARSLNDYIENHNWNVGGVNYPTSSSYTVNSDKGIEKEKTEEQQLTWIGKIGLLSITEYVEASLNPTCTSVRINIGSYSEKPCKEMNWSYKNYSQWSMSPNTKSKTAVYAFFSDGYFMNLGVANNPNGIRPAFYLKSTVGIEGEGTQANPYRIIEN